MAMLVYRRVALGSVTSSNFSSRLRQDLSEQKALAVMLGMNPMAALPCF